MELEAHIYTGLLKSVGYLDTVSTRLICQVMDNPKDAGAKPLNLIVTASYGGWKAFTSFEL
jgi:hypothetical protein